MTDINFVYNETVRKAAIKELNRMLKQVQFDLENISLILAYVNALPSKDGQVDHDENGDLINDEDIAFEDLELLEAAFEKFEKPSVATIFGY